MIVFFIHIEWRFIEQHTEAHRLMRKSKENYLIWLNNTRSD